MREYTLYVHFTCVQCTKIPYDLNLLWHLESFQSSLEIATGQILIKKYLCALYTACKMYIQHHNYFWVAILMGSFEAPLPFPSALIYHAS